MAHFAEKWEEITDNKWVLSIVRNGFRIPFIKIPPLSSVPIRMSQSSSPFLREEIENLLNKRAVERVQNPGTPGFYSKIFLVPKKNGKFRLILDQSLLNRYIEKQAFKMETVKSVRQAMRLNDWAVSIDLTDAYLHVPIHHQSRKYLRFVHEDQVYHFSALPFGMSLSPLIFSKLMDVIAAFLRQRAISVFPYLDDWLIKNLIRNHLITQTKFCIQTIQSLDFLPNLKKSDLFPAQKFTFIGMEFLTQQNLVRVPADRVQNLILTIKKIMSAKHVSARTFLSLLGKLSAAADLVLLGRLHLRPLQMCLLSVWKPHILPLDHPISINGMIRSHLQWWINPIRFETGTSIHPPDPEFFLYTDASHYGWGAHLEPTTLSFHGRWTENQSQLHINMLEMMAIRLALKQAKTFIHHSCIMISTDNTTVVSYINKQGGTHSPNLCVEVWKILNWCLEQDIVIRVRHIPGKFNILADRLSRLNKPIKTEWALDQTVANSVFQMLNFPNVDLFATRFNHRLPLYVSPVQDYKALAIDALESSSCICFSSFYSDTCCSRENPTTSVQNSSHSSVLATTTVVLRTSSSISVSSDSSATNSKTTDSIQRKICTSKPPNSRPSRLGVIKQSIRDKKFSQNVADFVSRSRRASTQKVYDAKWTIFSNWCHTKKVNPISAPITVIADFLIFLFSEKKCQISTIKGYRSMISNTLKFKTGNRIGSNPVLSELIRSFELQRPVQRSLTPKWDLSWVLVCLQKPPFEPLDKASKFHVTIKTAFLLALATAKRCSEIHALAMDSQHLRFNKSDGSVSLILKSGFLAKNQLPSVKPDPIVVPSLARICKWEHTDRLLYPVRALKFYLKMTSCYRQNRTRLFLPIKGNKDISKDTILRWIFYTVKLAYRKLTKRDISFLKIKAHEVRALSSSWAFFDKVPLNDILQAAVWNSSSTFAKFYLRDMSQQAQNLQSLGPIVVAQKVVGGQTAISYGCVDNVNSPPTPDAILEKVLIILYLYYIYIYLNPGLLYPWLKDLIIALSTNYVLIIYIKINLFTNNSEVGTNLLGEILPPILQILAHYL